MKNAIIAISFGILLSGSLLASCKCNKDDDDIPPMPSATTTQTKEPPLELVVEEDAGTDADAGEDSGKKKHGYSVSRLVRCCRVLAQNAKSAPPPNNAFMQQAAATCEAAARNGNYAAVNAALARFGLTCR